MLAWILEVCLIKEDILNNLWQFIANLSGQSRQNQDNGA